MKLFHIGSLVSLIAAITHSAGAGSNFAPPPANQIVVELADGSRVLGTPVVDQLELHTDYANLKLKLALIQTIEWDPEHHRARIRLHNGDQLQGRLSATSLDLKTVFGAVTIPVTKVQRLTAAGSCEPATGYALQFDGRQNYVSVPHDRALDPLEAMTLECWFRTTARGNYTMLGKHRWNAEGFDHGYQLHLSSNGRLNAYWEGDTLWGHVANDGRWHHIALTWDGTHRRLFQDGIEVAEDQPGVWTPYPGQFRIGAADRVDPQGFFAGTIAEVRLSNIVRYCGQNFAPKTGFTVDANTVGYWKLNEGAGTIIHDRSGHGHHGKLVGDPPPQWVKEAPRK